jgi:hypothetical protein
MTANNVVWPAVPLLLACMCCGALLLLSGLVIRAGSYFCPPRCCLACPAMLLLACTADFQRALDNCHSMVALAQIDSTHVDANVHMYMPFQGGQGGRHELLPLKLAAGKYPAPTKGQWH